MATADPKEAMLEIDEAELTRRIFAARSKHRMKGLRKYFVTCS